MKADTATQPEGRRLFASPRVYNSSLQMPVANWPQWDRDRWAAVNGAMGLLDPLAPPAAWRPPTVLCVAGAYGRWLQWLCGEGELDGASSPSERVTQSRLNAYVEALRLADCKPMTVVNYLSGLGMALDRLEPAVDHQWLWNAVRLLRSQARPSRKKWERIVPAQDLFAFGIELFYGAGTGDLIGDTVRARDGLIIAFLTALPLRVKNLQMLDIGTHLIRSAGAYEVSFEKEDMKNGRAYTWPLSAELTPMLDRYLSEHRPYLLSLARHPTTVEQAGRGMWISRFGTRMAPGTLTMITKQRTHAKFGKKVNVHLFRDCAATAIAINTPDNVGIAMEVLGHTSPATSERFYNHAQSQHASTSYQNDLRDMRKTFRRQDALQARSRR